LWRGTPRAAQTAYVREFLEFIGITDVEFVYAEGLAMGDAKKQVALAQRNRFVPDRDGVREAGQTVLPDPRRLRRFTATLAVMPAAPRNRGAAGMFCAGRTMSPLSKLDSAERGSGCDYLLPPGLRLSCFSVLSCW
jgi:hypothetical protein